MTCEDRVTRERLSGSWENDNSMLAYSSGSWENDNSVLAYSSPEWSSYFGKLSRAERRAERDKSLPTRPSGHTSGNTQRCQTHTLIHRNVHTRIRTQIHAHTYTQTPQVFINMPGSEAEDV